MSNLHVKIDYTKIAQWMKVVQFYLNKITAELDNAVITKEGGNDENNQLGDGQRSHVFGTAAINCENRKRALDGRCESP